MAALDNTQISNIENALTPTGAHGIPGTTFTAFAAASAMRIWQLNSTASTASAAGTEIATQTSGYTERHRVELAGRVDCEFGRVCGRCAALHDSVRLSPTGPRRRLSALT